MNKRVGVSLGKCDEIMQRNSRPMLVDNYIAVDGTPESMSNRTITKATI